MLEAKDKMNYLYGFVCNNLSYKSSLTSNMRNVRKLTAFVLEILYHQRLFSCITGNEDPKRR